MRNRKKEKVDTEALRSAFMHVPHMPVFVARYLLDAGYKDLFQIAGRAPESLFSEILKNDFFAPQERVLPALRLAVYFAENEYSLNRALLTLDAWKD